MANFSSIFDEIFAGIAAPAVPVGGGPTELRAPTIDRVLPASQPDRFGAIFDEVFNAPAPQPAATPPSEHGALARGFLGGMLEQNPQALGGGIEAGGVRLGSETLRNIGRSVSDLAGEPSRAYERKVPSFDKIGSLSELGTYLGESLGSGFASTLPSLATAILGGAAGGAIGGPVGAATGAAAGAATPSYVMNTGELFNRLKAEGVDEERAAKLATEWAIPVSALDTVSLTRLMKAFGAGKIATDAILDGYAKAVVKQAGKGGVREGGTEGLQQGIQEGVVATETGRDPFSQETMLATLDAAIQGAVTGAGMQAPAGFRRPRRQDAPPSEDPIRTEPDAPAAGPAPAASPVLALPAPDPLQAIAGPPDRPALPPPTTIYGDTFALGPGTEPTRAPPGGYRDATASELIGDALGEQIRQRIETPALPPSQTLYGEGFSAPPTDQTPTDGNRLRGEATLRRLGGYPDSAPWVENFAALPPGAPVTNSVLANVTGIRNVPELHQIRAQLVDMGLVEQRGRGFVRVAAPAPAIGTEIETPNQITPDNRDGNSPAVITPPISPPPPAQSPSINSPVKAAGYGQAGQIAPSISARPPSISPAPASLPPEAPAAPPALGAAAPAGAAERITPAAAGAAPRQELPPSAGPISATPPAFDPQDYVTRVEGALINRAVRPTPEAVGARFSLPPQQALRVLQAVAGTRPGVLRQAPDGSGFRLAPQRKQPLNLFEFIAASGGIRDDGGELRARDLTRKFIPGFGAMVRPTGLHMDYMRERAAEQGYLPMDTTVGDFLDLVSKQAFGQNVYPDGGFDWETTPEYRKAEQVDRQAMERRADDYGIDTAGLSDRQLAAELDRMAQVEAEVDAAERQAIQDIDGAAAEVPPQEQGDEFDIPFGLPQRAAGNPGPENQADPFAPSGPAERGDEGQSPGLPGATPEGSRAPGQGVAPQTPPRGGVSASKPRPQATSRDQTNTPEFRRWFRNSKVVDKNGRPLVVYHGTHGPIDRFDPDMLGSNTRAPSAQAGFFFTDRPKTADYYANNPDYSARRKNPQPTVVKAYLSLQNPLIHDYRGRFFKDASYRELIDRARAEGRDGVIMRNTYDSGEYGRFDAMMRGRFRPETLYVVFDPAQIKSTENRGAFDPADPRILYRVGDRNDTATPPNFERITDTLAVSYSPDTQAIREEAGRQIMGLLRRIGGKSLTQVVLVDHIHITDRDGNVTGENQGLYIPGGRQILISMQSVDRLATARHEAIHLLREAGAITEAQWRGLERRAREWRKRFEIDARYAGLDFTQDQLNEEAVAEAYGAWANGDLKLPPALRRAFEAVRRWLDGFRAILTGRGMREAMDRARAPERTFDAVERGEMAAGRGKDVAPALGAVDTAMFQRQDGAMESPRQAVAAEIERRYGPEIREQNGKWVFDGRQYRSREGALAAAFEQHAPKVAAEMGVDYRSKKEARRDAERRADATSVRDAYIGPYRDEARESLPADATPEEVDGVATALANEAERQDAREAQEDGRRARAEIIRQTADALSAALGESAKASGLSASRYVETPRGRIRISDHALPPTYDKLHGVPVIEIAVGADHADADFVIADESEIADVVGRVLARLKPQRGGGGSSGSGPVFARPPLRDTPDGSIDRTAQGEQRVMPGMERESDADYARRLSEKELKAKAKQRGIDDLPLFDTGGPKQGALFQRPMTAKQRHEFEKVFNRADRSLAARARELWGAIRDNTALRLKQGIVDDLAALEAAEKAAAPAKARDAATSGTGLARLTRNLDSVMATVIGIKSGKGFKGGALKYDQAAGVFETGAGAKPFLEIFRPIFDAGLQDQWAAWAVANRAKRLKAEGRENLVSDEFIRAFENLDQQHIADGKNLFRDAMRDWRGLNKAMLDMAEATGLLNAEQRALFENADYVPFYRVLEDETKGPWFKRGISGQRSGIKKLEGGTEKLGDIYENMVMNMTKLVDASMKNEAMRRVEANLQGTGALEPIGMDWRAAHVTGAQAAARLREIGVNVDKLDKAQRESWLKLFQMTPPKDPDVVSVMKDGKPEYFRVQDPMLLRSLTSLHPVQADAIMTMLGGARRLVTKLITADPAFMVANLLRDSVHNWVVTGGAFTPGIDTVKGAIKAARNDPSTIAIMAGGGGGGYFYDTTPAGVRKNLDGKGLGQTVLNSPRKIWDALQYMGRVSEMANRIAVYDAAIKAGKSKAQAIAEAQDVLNFTMRGDFAAIRFLAETVPFFNARLQGLYRLGRGAVDNPKKFLLLGSMITAASLALWAANADDERWKALEDWDKASYYHFFVGDKHFRLPKPFEIGAIFSTIPEIAGDYSKDGREKIVAQRVAQMFMDTFSMNPVPQAVKPLVDLYANRNSFTGRPIVGQAAERLKGEAQYGPNTGPIAVAVGQLSGLSPQQIEYAVNGYLGTMGTYVLGAADMLADQFVEGQRPTRRWDQTPVVKRFVREEPALSTRWLTEFYDLKKDVDELHNTINEYRKRGETARADEMQAENKEKLASRQGLNRMGQSLSDIRRQMRAVEYDKAMSADQKRARLDALMARRNEIAAGVRPVLERVENRP